MKKLGLRITEAFSRISGLAGEKPEDIFAAEIGTVLERYGNALFQEITGLWDWLFEYGAKGMDKPYEPVTQEWLEENVTITNLQDLVREIAGANRMGWLIPFFKSQISTVVRGGLGAMVGKAKEEAAAKEKAAAES